MACPYGYANQLQCARINFNRECKVFQPLYIAPIALLRHFSQDATRTIDKFGNACIGNYSRMLMHFDSSTILVLFKTMRYNFIVGSVAAHIRISKA
jgi:hypothetical protein